MPEAGHRGIWKRYLLGALLIVVATASATAVAAFREVDTVVDALRNGGGLDLGEGTLAEADAGKPQTILLIGSDKRAPTARDASDGSRSDTMILVRLDPSRRATALMSLPRDLKVQIPGHGTDRLNTAYAIGGTSLTVKTIKLFTGLAINHVVNVDFGGFKDAVNAIGCVYVDIDRRYYNDNSGPQQYATIDVPPGYQKLCGQDSLDYVRYRHTDNDIVRAARQQDFLRQAKSQVGAGRILADRGKLTRVFGKYARSDLRSRRSVLRLLKLVVASAGHPIREIHFRGRLGISYVTASDAQMRKLARQFLGVQESKGPRGESERRDRRKGVRKGAGGRLVDAAGPGKDQALQAVTAGARGLQIFYPRLSSPGATFAGSPRVYRICGPERGRCFRSYRMVIRAESIGEYYGLQGTTWRNPPILKSPTEVRTIRGRKYELHYDGDRVRLVAWRTKDAVYWVSNTLLQSLSKRQMLGIATSARSL